MKSDKASKPKRKQNYIRCTAKMEQDIADMLERFHSVSYVAEHIGLTYNTAKAAQQRIYRKERIGHSITDEQLTLLKQLYDEDALVPEMAAQLGVSNILVMSLLLHNKFKKRSLNERIKAYIDEVLKRDKDISKERVVQISKLTYAWFNAITSYLWELGVCDYSKYAGELELTEDILNAIKKLHDKGHYISSISEITGLTQDQVKRGLKQLGEKPKVYHKHWTQEEDDWLRKKWGRVSVKYMSIHLDRSVLAVTQRAYKLGFPSLTDAFDMHRETEIRRADFIRYTGISADRLMDNLIPKYGFPVHYRHEYGKHKTMLIDIEEATEWFGNNLDKFNSLKMNPDFFFELPDWWEAKRAADKELEQSNNSHKFERYQYTKQDEEYLRLYMKQNRSYEEIAKLLGKSEKSVIYKVQHMGIQPDMASVWTTADHRYIKEHYKEQTDAKMAEHLGKSSIAVSQARRKLGIYRLQCDGTTAKQIERRNSGRVARIVQAFDVPDSEQHLNSNDAPDISNNNRGDTNEA